MIFISNSFRTIVLVFIVSATVSSSLLLVSPVYLGIEMIQPGKSFLRWSLMIFISNSFQTIVLVFIVSATVSSSLLLVSPVYLGIEMIQPGKSFLKFECQQSNLKND